MRRAADALLRVRDGSSPRAPSELRTLRARSPSGVVPSWDFSKPFGILELQSPRCACCRSFWGKIWLFRASCEQVLLLEKDLALRKLQRTQEGGMNVNYCFPQA